MRTTQDAQAGSLERMVRPRSMCQILHHGKLEIETIGELRKIMPKLVKDSCYTATPSPVPSSYDDSCLCPLDLIATGTANGFKVEAEDGDFVTREWPNDRTERPGQ